MKELSGGWVITTVYILNQLIIMTSNNILVQQVIKWEEHKTDPHNNINSY